MADETPRPKIENVSGIDREAMAARKANKPGAGKGRSGQVRAADFFKLQAEIQSGQTKPDVVAERFAADIMETIQLMNLKPDTKEFKDFISGVRTDMAKEVKNKGHALPSGVVEGMKIMIDRLGQVQAEMRKQKVTERTEKIVTRVEKIANDSKNSHELERKEKLVKREEDLQKQAKAHQKKADELIVKREKLMGVDEKQFHLRGKLVDLEMKQRELYNKEIAKGDIQSKVMHEKSSKALELIGKADKESVEQKDKYDKDMLELMGSINDTLKAMGQAPLSERHEYRKQLVGLMGRGKAIADDPDRGPGRRAFGYHMKQYEKAVEPALRGPGVGAQLADWGKTAVKNTARDLWEQNVPMPLRIIGEAAFKGLKNSFGNSKQELYAKAKYSYEQDKITAVREKMLMGESDDFMEIDGEPIAMRHGKKSRRGRRGTSDRIVARGDSFAGAEDLRVKRIIVDKLEVTGKTGKHTPNDTTGGMHTRPSDPDYSGGWKPVKGGKTSLAEKIGITANTIKTGKGVNLFGLFKMFLGSLMTMFTGFGAMFMGTLGKLALAFGPLVGILAKALPLLGGAAAVAGAAAAGYYVGGKINDAANWAAEKITGRQGETAQSAIVAGVDKLQEKAGGLLGKSSAMQQKGDEVKASTKRFGELLKLQGGEMTSKQVAFWKGQGVDVSAAKVNENVTVLGTDNKPVQPRKTMETTDLVPDMIPKNQLMPDESPAEKARMASGGKDSALAAPSAAISRRTDMVDSASRQLEASKEVRTAKPTVVVNNVGGGSGGDKMQPPPISIGAARNQENAFARYLASNFAAL